MPIGNLRDKGGVTCALEGEDYVVRDDQLMGSEILRVRVSVSGQVIAEDIARAVIAARDIGFQYGLASVRRALGL